MHQDLPLNNIPFNPQTVVEQLIDQVYLFSRLYWEKTNHQGFAGYHQKPEMVAETYALSAYNL
jgi:hypothetical protein